MAFAARSAWAHSCLRRHQSIGGVGAESIGCRRRIRYGSTFGSGAAATAPGSTRHKGARGKSNGQ